MNAELTKDISLKAKMVNIMQLCNMMEISYYMKAIISFHKMLFGVVKLMVKDHNHIMLKFNLMEIVAFMMEMENLYGLQILGTKELLHLDL